MSTHPTLEKSKGNTWFSVLTRGPNAFDKIDLESNATLVYALKFMFFMALVSLLIDLPLIARIGGPLPGMAVPGVLVVETVVEYLTVELILCPCAVERQRSARESGLRFLPLQHREVRRFR